MLWVVTSQRWVLKHDLNISSAAQPFPSYFEEVNEQADYFQIDYNKVAQRYNVKWAKNVKRSVKNVFDKIREAAPPAAGSDGAGDGELEDEAPAQKKLISTKKAAPKKEAVSDGAGDNEREDEAPSKKKSAATKKAATKKAVTKKAATKKAAINKKFAIKKTFAIKKMSASTVANDGDDEQEGEAPAKKKSTITKNAASKKTVGKDPGPKKVSVSDTCSLLHIFCSLILHSGYQEDCHKAKETGKENQARIWARAKRRRDGGTHWQVYHSDHDRWQR